MPVTIYPTSNRTQLLPIAQHPPRNARELLDRVVGTCRDLLQSSLDDALPPACHPAKNGFVSSVFKAYSHHHHLIIRPEDIWFAILTQFSFYVNAHAEELRDHFVKHEGQKELEITYDCGGRYSADFANFAQEIGKLIQENVKDAGLRDWIIPNFSTTSDHDVVIASIVMMGTLQKYFSYKCTLACGLPSVTLKGEKSDYETILQRVEKLSQYGQEAGAFAALLKPIIRRFILGFEDPAREDVLDFWNRIFSHHHMFSGSDYYTGWITVFCFWDSEGRCIFRRGHDVLELDGVKYHPIDSDDVPSGYLTVPVKVDDNGDEFDAEMLAGSVGTIYSSSGEENAEGLIGLDTIEPLSAWWMYEKTAKTSATNEAAIAERFL